MTLPADEQKRICGEAAAALVENGMTIGLGTGTTAAWFVRSIAARGLKVKGVPTSEAIAQLAGDLGVDLVDLNQAVTLDLCVDGADECGPGLTLIKGGLGGVASLRLHRRRVQAGEEPGRVSAADRGDNLRPSHHRLADHRRPGGL
jgi:ribose 5-phosphate isomerase A